MSSVRMVLLSLSYQLILNSHVASKSSKSLSSNDGFRILIGSSSPWIARRLGWRTCRRVQVAQPLALLSAHCCCWTVYDVHRDDLVFWRPSETKITFLDGVSSCSKERIADGCWWHLAFVLIDVEVVGMLGWRIQCWVCPSTPQRWRGPHHMLVVWSWCWWVLLAWSSAPAPAPSVLAVVVAVVAVAVVVAVVVAMFACVCLSLFMRVFVSLCLFVFVCVCLCMTMCDYACRSYCTLGSADACRCLELTPDALDRLGDRYSATTFKSLVRFTADSLRWCHSAADSWHGAHRCPRALMIWADAQDVQT